jgi:hypothetical protein
MTLAEAARQYEESKRILAKHEPLKEAAADVLKTHFRKTGRSSYNDRIGYSTSQRTVLDQDKVKAELGKRLPRFQKTQTIESLSLLG